MANMKSLPIDFSSGLIDVPTKTKRKERVTTTLKQYWDRVRRDKPFPMESTINPEEVIDIWDSCFLVDANNETKEENYFYKHIGDLIKKAYDTELSDMEFDHIVSTHAAHLASDYEKVLAMKMPVYYEGELTIDSNRVMKYRQILLPVGSDGVNIQSIMGGFSYKIYTN